MQRLKTGEVVFIFATSLTYIRYSRENSFARPLLPEVILKMRLKLFQNCVRLEEVARMLLKYKVMGGLTERRHSILSTWNIVLRR